MNPDLPTSRARMVPLVLAAATILIQIVWVLVDGRARDLLTMASVLGFAGASATHMLCARGARWTGVYLMTTLGIGWGVEALGTATGFPFGSYEYTDLLGPRVGGVTWLIPLAWSMMAYPCLLVGRRLFADRVRSVLVAATLLASWDLFLDPQMVEEGYWVWREVGVHLPGIAAIPLSNFIGWWGTALVLFLLLDRLPRVPADDRVPAVLLSWTFASNLLAAAVFFGRPAVAVWGGLAMGCCMVPWWRAMYRERA